MNHPEFFDIDLQLFAEGADDLDDPTDGDLGDLDPDGTTGDSNTDGQPDKGAEDLETDGEPTDKSENDQPDLFELPEIGEFTADDAKAWKDAFDNMKAWRAEGAQRGEALNKQARELETKLKETEEIRSLAEEYRKVKKSMTPEAYAYLQKLQAEGTDPRVAQLESKFDQKISDLDYKEAITTLQGEFGKDFDQKAVQELLSGFDWENPRPYDVLKIGYWALNGKNMDAKIKDARAKDAETRSKRKGVKPPVRGRAGPSKPVGPEPQSIDEGLERALGDLAAGKSIF